MAATILVRLEVHWQLLSGWVSLGRSWCWGPYPWRLTGWEGSSSTRDSHCYSASGKEYLGLQGDREEGAGRLAHRNVNGAVVEDVRVVEEELFGVFLAMLEESALRVFLHGGVVGESSCLYQVDHYYYLIENLPPTSIFTFKILQHTLNTLKSQAYLLNFSYLFTT